VSASEALSAIAAADLAPLDIEADLTLAIDGEAVRVVSKTNKPLVDLPSTSAALALFRQGGGALPELAELLAAADITAGVAIDGTGVAVIGADAEPGTVTGRIIPHVEFRENGLARTLIDEAFGR
jgi:hypothetical protein